MKRLLLLSLMVFIALSPIVWIRFFESSVALFHISGLFFLAVLFLQPAAFWGFFKLADHGKPIWLSCFALMSVTILMLSKTYTSFPIDSIAKYAAYLMFSFSCGVAVLIIMRERMFHYFYVMPLMSAIVLTIFVRQSLAVAGIDLGTTFVRALEAGNPNMLIFPLFKGLFQSGLEEARANMRHGLALVMVCSALIGIGAHMLHPRQTNWTRAVAWGGASLCVAIVLFSFSRSAWLALFLAGTALSTQLVRNGTRLFIAFNGFLAVAMAAAFLPATQLLLARLESSGSYDGRLTAAGNRWVEIGRHPFWGSPIPPPVKAHNLLIDYWASTGILGGIAALSLIVAVAWLAGRCMLASQRGPVLAVVAALLFLPLARFFTAPDGLPEIGGWIALGIATGLAAVFLERPKRDRPYGWPQTDVNRTVM